MMLAISEAKQANTCGDVPVGAVIVRNNEIVATSHNEREYRKTSLGHAEILAISKACDKLDKWRLDDCDLYVTLEPCIMCTGAIIESRIRRVYFGAFDAKYGFVASNDHLKSHIKFDYYCGIMEDECKNLIDGFFTGLRSSNTSASKYNKLMNK